MISLNHDRVSLYFDFTASAEQTVPEDRQIYIRCLPNQYITIDSASYGVKPPTGTNCGTADNSLSQVQDKCHLLMTECGFIVNNAFFLEDPCPSSNALVLDVKNSCNNQGECSHSQRPCLA